MARTSSRCSKYSIVFTDDLPFSLTADHNLDMTSVGDKDSTPFVWFGNGLPVFPPNTVCEDGKRVLEELASTESTHSLDQLVEEGIVGGSRSVLPEATWFAYCKDFFAQTSDRPPIGFLKGAFRASLIPELSDAWASLKRLIIEEIDECSGWNYCWMKDSARLERIERGDDGYYYHVEADGTRTRFISLIGPSKTAPETRLDYICDSIVRPYGAIRSILDMFAIVAISRDFDSNPHRYPTSLRYYAWDPRWGIMPSPHWHWSHYFETHQLKWRPDNNLCDADWLAFQLLGEVTDNIDKNVWEEHLRLFAENPNPLSEPFQMDFALETPLRIGEKNDVPLEYEGRHYRWINANPNSRPILSVGCASNRDYRQATEAADRLISLLVWEHQHPIVRLWGTGGPRRNLPWIGAARRVGGMQILPQHAIPSERIGSSDKWLALALYKEGKNSGSFFYAFLNYWKILELGKPNENDRYTWVENNIETLQGGKKWKDHVLKADGTVRAYLEQSRRDAIAHAKIQPTVNPDDYEDNKRIREDAGVLHDLARRLIGSDLLDNPRPPRPRSKRRHKA